MVREHDSFQLHQALDLTQLCCTGRLALHVKFLPLVDGADVAGGEQEAEEEPDGPPVNAVNLEKRWNQVRCGTFVFHPSIIREPIKTDKHDGLVCSPTRWKVRRLRVK